MGLLTFRKHDQALKTQPVRRAPRWMLDDARDGRFQVPDGSLAYHQTDLYTKLSWVQLAVSAVAQACAVVPFHVKRRVREQLRDVTNHPFEVLLRRPNPLQSRFEFLVAIASSYALSGNAYVWLNKATPTSLPSEMWVLPTYKVRPLPDGKLYLAGYEYDTGAGFETLPPDQVVHFKRFHPLNSWVGLSPVEALATVAVGDLKMQEWNTNFFGQDNAKVPGALAFKDVINELDWETLKADLTQQHGGVRRSLMLLRGVGQGGVEWVQMGLPQKDMEFLASRHFNKEEIYGIFAPGLASALAINATEANSITGKATLIEFAVWPLLVAMAEKISNDILPLYDRRSSALHMGEFSDIRHTDRRLELEEQDRYARYHTVDEVRAKYYDTGPLGASEVALKANG